MERVILTTADGSTTIRLPEWDECYHSTHGAVQEANHVFIRNGLARLTEKESVAILEIGFGTGLNALVTYDHVLQTGQKVNYTGVEGFPVDTEMALSMNYPVIVGKGLEDVFAKMHMAPWESEFSLSRNFTLEKRQLMFQEIRDAAVYDLIYFDAFGYRVQPELWSEEIFTIMHRALKPGGLLITYAARGAIRRNMEAAGFKVSKHPGPPGKREMMTALKFDRAQ